MNELIEQLAISLMEDDKPVRLSMTVYMRRAKRVLDIAEPIIRKDEREKVLSWVVDWLKVEVSKWHFSLVTNEKISVSDLPNRLKAQIAQEYRGESNR